MFTLGDLHRREMLRQALWLCGATVGVSAAFDAIAATPKRAARILSQPRFALLTAVVDTIIPKTETPGAVEAGVPGLVDALLRDWASPARRDELIGALDRIDLAAKAVGGKVFTALPPQKRFDLLSAFDAQALAPPPKPSTDLKSGSLQDGSLMSGPKQSDPAYAKLKELVLVSFYFSETALTHDLAYEHQPGKWQPSIPVTPMTRPEGGPTLI